MNDRTGPGRPVYDAVVIGAGHNGLVAAAYLARAGLDVLVLERRHVVGGAAATEELVPGFKFSSCSYLIHMLQAEVATDLALESRGLRTVHLDPKTVHLFPDREPLFFWSDRKRTCAEIASISRDDAVGFQRWEQFWDRAGALLGRYAMTVPPSLEQLQAAVAGSEDEEVLRQLLEGTLEQLLDAHFASDPVRAAVACNVYPPITDPAEVGALLGCAALAANRVAESAFQGLPIGGMGALAEALADAARDAGATVRTGAEVGRILVDDGEAVGVELTDGQLIMATTVISNADPQRTFLHLMRDGDVEERIRSGIGDLQTGYGTMKFHAAVAELPDLSEHLGSNPDPHHFSHIHICPDMDYFWASVREAAAGDPTGHPLISMQIPTVYDSSLAPEGRHIVSMWVRFAPSVPTGTSWSQIREREGQRIIDLLTEYAPNFASSIIDWLLFTPADLERRVGLPGGNIHHLNHAPGQMLGDRLFPGGGHRTPVPRLYMCGAGTHPGGEVSGAPGYNAARVVLEDVGAQAGR